MGTMGPEPLVVSREDAAHMLALSVKTLESWARQGVGPRPVRLGRRRVGYRVSALRRWVRDRERKTRRVA